MSTDEKHDGIRRMASMAVEAALEPKQSSMIQLAARGKTEEDVVAEFRERLVANLNETAKILDDMKAAGGYAFNHAYALDHRGKHVLQSLAIVKVFP